MAKQLPIESPAYVARRMWNYLAAHKGRALYTFVVYMVSTLMGAVVPLQIGATVDEWWRASSPATRGSRF